MTSGLSFRVPDLLQRWRKAEVSDGLFVCQLRRSCDGLVSGWKRRDMREIRPLKAVLIYHIGQRGRLFIDCGKEKCGRFEMNCGTFEVGLSS